MHEVAVPATDENKNTNKTTISRVRWQSIDIKRAMIDTQNYFKLDTCHNQMKWLYLLY